MTSENYYAFFRHDDGSWYRLWTTHTTPKTDRGVPWHLHASYDKTGTIAPVAGTKWYDQPYGMTDWDFDTEAEALEAFETRMQERLAHGYDLIESLEPAPKIEGEIEL